MSDVKKLCRRCNQVKDIEEFAKQKGTSKGYRGWCKICHNEYYRNYYKKNGGMKKHEGIVYARKKRIKQRLAELKIKLGCKICRYNKCSNSLHFHHLDRTQKIFNLSTAPSKALEDIENEIAKCVVLCSNCHGELEFGMISL